MIGRVISWSSFVKREYCSFLEVLCNGSSCHEVVKTKFDVTEVFILTVSGNP